MNNNNYVFVYSIKDDTWSKIVPNIALPKVDAHTSVLWEGKIYVYGGYIPEIATFMTDIYAFSLDKNTWELYYKGGSATE
jgi:N-acetylneuraminic acid mutarotase